MRIADVVGALRHARSGSRSRLELAGELSEMGVVDLVQVMDVARKSGVVQLRSGEQQGALYVRDGTLVDAEFGCIRGKAAADALLGWTEGSFEVDFADVVREETIHEGNPAVLVGALTAQDERRGELLLPSLQGLSDLDPEELEGWGIEPPRPGRETKPTSPPRRRGRRWALTSVAAAVAACSMMLWLGPWAGQSNARPMRAGASATPQEVRVPRATEALAPSAAEPAPPPVEPAPPVQPEHSYALIALSTPPGAAVFVGDHPRGRTPCRVDIGSLERSVEVRLVRAGFEPFVGKVRRGGDWREQDGQLVRTLRVELRTAGAAPEAPSLDEAPAAEPSAAPGAETAPVAPEAASAP